MADANGHIDVLNNIVAPLIVAACTGIIGWIWAKAEARKKIRERVDAAPRIFVQELDYLIQRAEREGVENAIVNGRAIVAARDALRSSLSGISRQLNSEIDRLAGQIGVESPSPYHDVATAARRPPDEPQIAYETIQVLTRIWPAKKQQIEVELRKLMAELGLDFRETL